MWYGDRAKHIPVMLETRKILGGKTGPCLLRGPRGLNTRQVCVLRRQIRHVFCELTYQSWLARYK